MAYNIDADKMLDVLRIGREEDVRQGHKSSNKRVDPMRSQTGLPATRSSPASWPRSRRPAARPGSYTDRAELEAARELMETKFLTEAWTHRVP